MTINECCKYLYDLTNIEQNLSSPAAKKHYSLDNIRYLLGRLLAKYPDLLSGKKVVHIAGTKGKGSTAYLISSILMCRYDVATFVSPHLIRPNERIMFNLAPISDDDFVDITQRLLDLLDGSPVMPTTFEAFYLMYLIYAHRKNVQMLVVETGLGGRLDATNVIDSDAAVITPIGYDHTEILGQTIEAIASEKAAIIKSAGQHAVIAKQYYDVGDVFVRQAQNVNADIVFVDKEPVLNATFSDYGYNIDLGDTALRLECLGRHQLDNLAAAITAVNSLKINIDYRKVKLRLPPARIEVLNKSPLVILDVAHNRESVDSLVETLAETFENVKFQVLSGLAADKDYKYFYKKLSSIATRIIITNLASGKYSDPETIYQYTRTLLPCEFVGDVKQAIKKAFSSDEPLLVTGSFYLSGPVMEYIMQKQACKSV